MGLKKFFLSALIIFSFSVLLFSFSDDWSTLTPAGTESKSLGDDRIRQMKSEIQNALQFQGVFPGADSTTPRFMQKLSTTTTSGRPTGNNVSTGTWIINKTSATIEQYDGTNWNAIDVVRSSSITEGKLDVSVAGAGLGGGGGVPLRVQYDTNTFTVTSDSITLNSTVGTSFLVAGTTIAYGNGNTRYFVAPLQNNSIETETELSVIVPYNSTASRLYGKWQANAFSDDRTLTLMVNGVASALTCHSTALSCSDVSNSVSISAGDTVSIRLANGSVMGYFKAAVMFKSVL